MKIYTTKWYLVERIKDSTAPQWVILDVGSFKTESRAFGSMFYTARIGPDGGLAQERTPEYAGRRVKTVKGRDILAYPRLYLRPASVAILSKLDAAIARLEAIDDPLSATLPRCIERLKAKRATVLSGNYTLRTVNEEALAAVGHMIAEWAQTYLYRGANR